MTEIEVTAKLAGHLSKIVMDVRALEVRVSNLEASVKDIVSTIEQAVKEVQRLDATPYDPTSPTPEQAPQS
jgi:hypothetical protein